MRKNKKIEEKIEKEKSRKTKDLSDKFPGSMNFFTPCFKMFL